MFLYILFTDIRKITSQWEQQTCHDIIFARENNEYQIFTTKEIKIRENYE